MATTTVIIHGWSDCSESFERVKDYLLRAEIGEVATILYADYESREDNLTYNDIIHGLNEKFIEHNIISADGTKLRDVNVIVHSTGGLVIRHWLSRYYDEPWKLQQLCPVKRIVMLAPANFGSPLAHRGKSFLGSLVKGRWKVGDFLEVGRQILDGLELASEYQWYLAHQDILSETSYYAPEAVQLTILVGADDYTGLRGWVNKPGTDGTVVISGTPLNTVKLTFDFTEEGRNVHKPTLAGDSPLAARRVTPDFAFAVVPGLDHGSIVRAAAHEIDSAAGALFLEALRCEGSAPFERLKQACQTVTEETYASPERKRFQQFIFHCIDDQDAPVRDYTLEFYVRANDDLVGASSTDQDLTPTEERYSDEVQKAIVAEAHTYELDHSYRRLLLCQADVEDLMARAKGEMGREIALCLRVHIPDIDRQIRYRTDRLQQLVVDRTDAQVSPSLFFPNTTTLIEIRVDRFTGYVTLSDQPHRH